MCTFALTAEECSIYCKGECKQNWTSGVYRRRYTIVGKEQTDEILPVPPFYCPSGKEESPSWAEKKRKKLTKGQVAGIVLGSIGVVIIIVLLILYREVTKRQKDAQKTISGTRTSGPQRGLSAL